MLKSKITQNCIPLCTESFRPMESSKTLTATHLGNDKEDLGFVEQGLHDLPSPTQSKVPGHESCPQGNHISREKEGEIYPEPR